MTSGEGLLSMKYLHILVEINLRQLSEAHKSSITANNWNHYAVTYDQSNVRVYLNGVKVHTAALTRSGGNHQNNFETFIGKYRPQSSGSEQSNQLFRGKLDNI